MSARRLKKAERLSDDGRYELLIRLASGGMGAVFLGYLRDRPGQLYAIKRAHTHLVELPEFRNMFVAEARLASRIDHANAIGVIDVDDSDGELLMVMRYVEGGSLSDMLVASSERGRRIPPPVTVRILVDAARGLQAAHEVCDEQGQPLGIVHRDVSPHNILVGLDGVGAIVDFGVAKAASIETTRTATDILKGKFAYMAPEYVKSRIANARTDVFSLATVAWEALANRRLFKGTDELDTMRRILSLEPTPPLGEVVSIDPTVGAVIARGLARDPSKRFPTARSFGDALEKAARDAELLATPTEVSTAVRELLAAELQERRVLLASALGEAPQHGGAGAHSVSPMTMTAMALPDGLDQTTTHDVASELPAQTMTLAAATERSGPPRPPPTLTAAAATVRAAPGASPPKMTVPRDTLRMPEHVATTVWEDRTGSAADFQMPAAPTVTIALAPASVSAPPSSLPVPTSKAPPAHGVGRAALAAVAAFVVSLAAAATVGRDLLFRAGPSADASGVRTEASAPAVPPVVEDREPGGPAEAPSASPPVPSSRTESPPSASSDPSSVAVSPSASAPGSTAPSSGSPASSAGRPQGRPPGWRPKANPYGK